MGAVSSTFLASHAAMNWRDCAHAGEDPEAAGAVAIVTCSS